MFEKTLCKDCVLPSSYHIQTWLQECIDKVLPPLSLPKKLQDIFDVLLEKCLEGIGLITLKDDFALSEVQMRSACFIREAQKRGVGFRVAKGPFGYTNHFCAVVQGKTIRFESLPIADFAAPYKVSLIGDKERTKRYLLKGGFPVAQGRSFWFWQKRRAIHYGAYILGFPLVVKPRGGSVARHVTTNVESEEGLSRAIDKAIVYSPAFMVERFLKHSFVHRATVVDFDYAACVKQVPANVVGDGVSTIQELVQRKNADARRGEPGQKNFTLCKLVMDDTIKKLSVPQPLAVVYLQRDPFLKLGGDLVEVTEKVHQDNMQLFRDVARFFDVRIVGIDFIASDISQSWKTQECAVLELNSAPCIEMHHFPSSGKAQNVAGALVDLFFKYYV